MDHHWTTSEVPTIFSSLCFALTFTFQSSWQLISKSFYHLLLENVVSALQFSSVQFSCSFVSDSLWPHGLQRARSPCPSSTPKFTQTHVHWVGDAIQSSSSVVPFSSCLQSFPASGSFPVSQFFSSGGQSIRILPMNIQHWFPLGLTGWISLQFKGLSRVFCA